MNKQNASIVVVLSSFMFLIFIVSIFALIIPYSDFDEYKLNKCYISKIEYPTLPINNSYNGWETCHCGRKCDSYSPCIKLYSNVSETMYLQEDFFRKDQNCTFHNSSCISNQQDYLKNSQDIYNYYINRTIDCYYNTHLTSIYIEKNINLEVILIFSIFFGFFFILCMSVILVDCFKSKKNKEKIIE